MSVKSQIDKIIAKLNNAKKEVVAEMTQVGDEAVELIKNRTRKGFGVEAQGGNKKKLKKLSDKYKKSRKKNKPKGHSATAGKSNLTHSGDMLEDLEAKKRGNKVRIDLASKESADKAEWVSKDRAFNNLSKSELKQLKQSLEKKIKKEAKKI